MDNVTHSLTGLAIGEFVHRGLRDEDAPDHQRTRRRLLLFTAWAASNFPDLDLVLTPLLPPPLGYLLHHRGHTHTFLYLLPQALLLWLLVSACWPAARSLLARSASTRRGFLIALATGLALHIGMDFLNSYGVHPLHPFDTRWFYGDMVFIVEPVFWVAFGVPVAMALPGRWLKAALLLVLTAAMLFFKLRGFLLWPSLAALLAIGVLTAALQRHAGARGRTGLVTAFAIAIVFAGGQAWWSAQAGDAVARALHGRGGRLLDTALTAYPANPACWTFVSVESDEAADRYTVRRGTVSAMPGLLPVAACPVAFAEPSPMQYLGPGVAVAWEGSASLNLLRNLRMTDCRVDAWLRFARTPVVDGATAFDARFATSARGNFTTMQIEPGRRPECAGPIPQWGFPRADLLATPARGQPVQAARQ
ncbi:metal-dependent hydrolase [Oxalobacteraceae bacterium OM1]|nr:metal-dependent hydrolase [Oxalobacteraceae bacterium OM1]